MFQDRWRQFVVHLGGLAWRRGTSHWCICVERLEKTTTSLTWQSGFACTCVADFDMLLKADFNMYRTGPSPGGGETEQGLLGSFPLMQIRQCA